MSDDNCEFETMSTQEVSDILGACQRKMSVAAGRLNRAYLKFNKTLDGNEDDSLGNEALNTWSDAMDEVSFYAFCISHAQAHMPSCEQTEAPLDAKAAVSEVEAILRGE